MTSDDFESLNDMWRTLQEKLYATITVRFPVQVEIPDLGKLAWMKLQNKWTIAFREPDKEWQSILTGAFRFRIEAARGVNDLVLAIKKMQKSMPAHIEAAREQLQKALQEIKG